MLQELRNFPFMEVNNNRLPGITPNEKVVSPMDELNVKKDICICRRHLGNRDKVNPGILVASIVKVNASIKIPNGKTKAVRGKGRVPAVFIAYISPKTSDTGIDLRAPSYDLPFFYSGTVLEVDETKASISGFRRIAVALTVFHS